MLTVNPSRAARFIGPAALAAVLMALAACGSPTVARRVAIVETNGRARFDAASITVTNGDTLELGGVSEEEQRQVAKDWMARHERPAARRKTAPPPAT